MTTTYETDYDEVRNALSYLDPNDRETWWKVGAALKSEFDEGGRSLWEDWSRSYPKWNERESNAQWKSFKYGHIHIGTLFHMAKANGFTFSQSYRAPSAEEIAHREAIWAVKREVQAAWDSAAKQHAQRTANTVWNSRNTRPADAAFPYLQNKGIADPAVLSHVRINAYNGKEQLVIPMYDRPNHIVNRQAIDANGGKFFLPGGEVSGAYGKIAAPNADWMGGVYLAEGFATAASIHTATGKPVVIAFNAGNLPKVAEKMAAMLPDNTPIYIAADNDASQTGIKKAAEAAQVLGSRARVVMPEFDEGDIARFQTKHGQDALPSDFNDLHELQGLEAVKTALSTPLSPDRLPETEIRLGSVFTLNGTMGRNALVIGRKSDPDTGRTEYAYLKYDGLSPETVSVRKIFGNPQTIGDWRDGSSAVRYYQAPHYGEAYFREHWGGEIGKLQSAGFETVSLHGLKNIFDGKEIEAPSPQSDVRPDPAELHRIRETEMAKIQNEKIRAAVRQELARRDGLGQPEKQPAQHETVQQQGLDEGGDTPFTRAVDAVMGNRHIPQRHIPLGTTPPALQLAGLPDTQIEIQAHVLHKILAGKHYLTADDIKRLPSELNNPVAVLRSSPTSQNPDGFVVMTELKESDYDLNNRPVNKSVIASLFLKETPKGLQVIGISSVYGRWKSQIENAVKNDTVLYWHKEKGFQLLNSLGLRLPPRLSSDENLSRLNIKTETDLVQWQNAQKRPIQPNPQQFIPTAPQEKTMAQSPTLTPEQIRSYAQRIANITDEADRNAAIDEFAENHGTNIRRQVGEILQERVAESENGRTAQNNGTAYSQDNPYAPWAADDDEVRRNADDWEARKPLTETMLSEFNAKAERQGFATYIDSRHADGGVFQADKSVENGAYRIEIEGMFKNHGGQSVYESARDFTVSFHENGEITDYLYTNDLDAALAQSNRWLQSHEMPENNPSMEQQLKTELENIALPENMYFETETLSNGRAIARIQIQGYDNGIMLDKLEQGGYIATFNDFHLEFNQLSALREMTSRLEREYMESQAMRETDENRSQTAAEQAAVSASDSPEPQAAPEQAADTQPESAAETAPDEENGIEFDGEAQDLEQEAPEAEPVSRQHENPAPERETITAEEVRQNLARARAAEALERQDGQKQPVPERQPETVPQQQETRPQTAPEADLGSLFDEAAPQSAREPAPSENPAVPQKPKPILDLNYATATGLEARYVRVDGKYMDLHDRKTVVFKDKGSVLKTGKSDAQTVSDMLDTAQAKNWGVIKISGSHEFKQQMWLESQLRGIPSKGYKPNAYDIAKRDQLLEERQRNGIEQIQPQQSRQPENSSVQSSSAEPHSQDRKVQTAESQKGVMLLEHGAAPYLHNPDNRTNYFVKYEQDGEIRERWGVELESALTESGAQAGDRIEIHDLGRQPVVVNILVRDESGKIVRDEQGNKVFEEKEVEKNLFRIEVLERQQDRQPEQLSVQEKPVFGQPNGAEVSQNTAAAPDNGTQQLAEAGRLQTQADMPDEVRQAAQFKTEAVRNTQEMQAAAAPQTAAAVNPGLDSARALFQEKYAKLGDDAKARLAWNWQKVHEPYLKSLKAAGQNKWHDAALKAYYENTAKLMHGKSVKLEAVFTDASPAQLKNYEQTVLQQQRQQTQTQQQNEQVQKKGRKM